MSQNNHVRKVAIVGAGGFVGSHIVDELLKLGKHEVTAITRNDSKAAIPEGVKAAKVDYDDHTTLVKALRGQDVLIITMSVLAPRDTSSKLIEAAAAANVPYVMPNEWGFDKSNESLGNDTLAGPDGRAVWKHIEDLGKSSWMGLVSGFWYEYSLAAGTDTYGMDWKSRSMTFFDDGETKINTITLPQTGKAVARLLSLPIKPEAQGEPSLSDYKNKLVYVSSFLVSQKDMFASVLRVTGTREADWKITYEGAAKRYEDGKKQLTDGDSAGFRKMMYARVFFKNGGGNFEEISGRANEVLGLTQEDLDEFTKAALSRAEKGVTYPVTQ